MSETRPGEREKRDGYGRPYRTMEHAAVVELMRKLNLSHENTAMGQYNLVDRKTGEIVGLGQADPDDPHDTEETVSLSVDMWREYDEAT